MVFFQATRVSRHQKS